MFLQRHLQCIDRPNNSLYQMTQVVNEHFDLGRLEEAGQLCLPCIVCANYHVQRIKSASIHLLSPPYIHPAKWVGPMPYTAHILFTFVTQQVMLFAFYFFLRKKELRLAQQVRFLASETALDGLPL